MKPSSTAFQQLLRKATRLAYAALLSFVVAIGLLLFKMNDPNFMVFKTDKNNKELVVDDELIENGIHVRTGLVEDTGLRVVINNCTNCHSAKLVIQNRMNKDRWNATILWMQETQNLWDLGGNQEIIVSYLVKNYPPIETGRRAGLTKIEWYELEN